MDVPAGIRPGSHEVCPVGGPSQRNLRPGHEARGVSFSGGRFDRREVHMPAVTTNGLTKTFTSRSPRGGRTVVEAVRGITFQVERGERLAYIGPNGAGKSTSIKILTGILHPTTGEATVLGLVPWKER